MKLLNKNFVLLWQGQFVSMMGNQALMMAYMMWLKHTTGSATLIGSVMMVSALSFVLFGPIGGAFADRYSRLLLIIISDVVSGFAVLALAFLMFWSPDATTAIIPLMFVVSIVISVSGAFFVPAISAAIPDLVPVGKINQANSLNQSSTQISVIFGQALGGVLYGIWGARVLILVDGISFLVAAISESFVDIPGTLPEKDPRMGGIFKKLDKDLRDGINYVRNYSGLKRLLIAFAALNFFSAPLVILLPFYVEDFLKVSSDWYGYLMAAHSLGILLGFVVAGAAKISGESRSQLTVFLLVAVSVSFSSLGFVKSTAVAFVLAFVIGTMLGMINLNVLTTLQLRTPAAIRGRVFGLMTTTTGALAPIGMGLAGVAGDLTNKNIPLIFTLSGLGLLLVSLAVSTNYEFRSYLALETLETSDVS